MKLPIMGCLCYLKLLNEFQTLAVGYIAVNLILGPYLLDFMLCRPVLKK